VTPDNPPITLPASSVTQLAELLTELDEFLRSGNIVAELADFLAARGHVHPGFSACNLIDEASFTALYLRELTRSNPRATGEHTHLADRADGERAQDG
jgi:hypothetical protein